MPSIVFEPARRLRYAAVRQAGEQYCRGWRTRQMGRPHCPHTGCTGAVTPWDWEFPVRRSVTPSRPCLSCEGGVEAGIPWGIVPLDGLVAGRRAAERVSETAGAGLLHHQRHPEHRLPQSESAGNTDRLSGSSGATVHGTASVAVRRCAVAAERIGPRLTAAGPTAAVPVSLGGPLRGGAAVGRRREPRPPAVV